MKTQFHSRLKKFITGFIEQKRALGRVYSREEQRLKDFDSFCVNHYPSESTLTKTMALKWAEVRENENQGRYMRISLIRELAKYMNSLGVDSYVTPSYFLPRVTRYIPHLYTSDELSEIFSVLDRLEPCTRSPVRHIVIPTMFRMVYCCGLRPKEGRNILRNDVDLKTGQIVVRDAKCHKDRVIALSADMLELCRLYDKTINTVFLERQYFFPNHVGNAYSASRQTAIYRQCLKKVKMSFPGNRPRIYDLRHTFATNVLFRWMREDKDMNAYLPYLSAYLGHEHFSETAYYIHLVPQFFSQISDACLSKHSHLIPELENEN